MVPPAKARAKGSITDATLTATATFTDSYSSVSKKSVLPTVAVTMDFHNSGTGVAFGKVAEAESYLDVNWYALFRKYLIAKSALFAPLIVNRSDNDKEAAIQFENTNGVLGYVGMMGDTNGGLRRWTANSGTSYLVLDEDNTKDYVIAEGSTGIWNYRKWKNGDAECWGNLSITPTTGNATNSTTVNLPFDFVSDSSNTYKVYITPAKTALYIGSFGDCNSSNNMSHTTNSFVMSYKYNNATPYNVSFNLTVKGRWK